jgi:hypothetical protein
MQLQDSFGRKPSGGVRTKVRVKGNAYDPNRLYTYMETL